MTGFPRALIRALAATTLGMAVAGLALPTAATAAAPTRVTDRTVEVYCNATGSHGEDVNFYVAQSDLSGTSGAVQASDANGEYLARGEGAGTSEWTADGFRAAVEVTDVSGDALGTAYLAGAYALTGTPQRFTSKFKDGNVRVVEDHAFTPVEVRRVVLTVPGIDVVDVGCDGASTSGSLFFTNPTAHVTRAGGLVVQDCRLDNATDLFVEGSIDALALGFGYADAPDFSVFTPELDLSGGSWNGTVNAADNEGPVPVAAAATLTRTGATMRTGTSGPAGSERWTITPYELDVRVAGPVGPARVTCQLLDVDVRFRTMGG
jgi:hypothetical protein